ncbi:hypothetical protein HU200_042001 [Digitaria exilis]|uniref:Uncharacterized protein n=1 Tax=Digitaria exilis TaxID=1010633 RepID=A0A835B7U0_9POAL|nr:hypothetical protein HU200_042001 [Digitaria exilis]
MPDLTPPPLPPPVGSGGRHRLRRHPPPPPSTNPLGLHAPTASTAHRGSSTARLRRRPRRLRSAAVSPASTVGRRAARSFLYVRCRVPVKGVPQLRPRTTQ